MSDAQSWYVGHTKVHQGALVCENLPRQGYAAYLPRINVIKRIRGLSHVEPLFPRYVFVQPASTQHHWPPSGRPWGCLPSFVLAWSLDK